jgi:hypothetical protein
MVTMKPSFLPLEASAVVIPFASNVSFANIDLVYHDGKARADTLQHRGPLLFAESRTN